MADSLKTAQSNDPSRPPNSWFRIVFALFVLIGAAATMTLLIGKFLENRPLDLYGPSEKAMDAVEEVLLANRVPPEFIKKHGPALRQPQDAHWYYYEYRVRIPEALSIAGMEELIAKRLLRLYGNVFVSDLMEDGRKQGIQLSFDSFVFADIYLDRNDPSGRVAPQLAPTNLTPAPTRNADALEVEENLDDFNSFEFEPRGGVANLDASFDAPDPVTAKLAIILDDGGYGGETTERILALSSAFTLAILPNTPYGTDTARRAAELGFELMLHMPMENIDPTLYPHEGQLEIDMTDQTIAALTRDALDQVPGAIGINNHMGSRFTADTTAMASFFKAIEHTALFFIDSRTTADTIAYQDAVDLGLRCARRDVFLDHENDPDTIRRQLDEAISLAKTQGQAIAIGHFRPDTVDVLTDMLPLLHDQGVELVHVSNLIP